MGIGSFGGIGGRPIGGVINVSATAPTRPNAQNLPPVAPSRHGLYQAAFVTSLALLTTVQVQPFHQHDWPVPRGAVPSIVLRTHVDQTKINLIGQDQLPKNKSDWPVPRGPARASDLVVFLQNGFLTLNVRPNAQYSWPVPPGALQGVITNKTHIDQTKRLLIGADQLPENQYDWPVPKGPARSSALVTWINPGLGPVVVRPQINYDWPVPRGAARSIDTLTWAQPGLSLQTVVVVYPVGFGQFDWPVPKGPTASISLRTHIHPLNLLAGKDTFTAAGNDFDWPNPRGWVRSFDLTLAQSGLALNNTTAQKPNANYDWPNPRGTTFVAQLYEVDHLSFLFVPDAPVIGTEFPNPYPRSPQRSFDLTWLDSGLSLQSAAPAAKPYQQLDWPNPRGALRNNQDWLESGLALTSVIGQVPFSQTDWLVPKGKTPPVPDWIFVKFNGESPPSESVLRAPHIAGPVVPLERVVQDWIWQTNINLPIPVSVVVHLGPGFVEIDPTKQWAPVEPHPPRRHRVERELDKLHLRRIIERAYADQKQPVESIVDYLTQLMLAGQLMPADYLAMLYAQLPRDLLDVDAIIMAVEQEIYRRRMEIEERDMEAILLALGDL